MRRHRHHRTGAVVGHHEIGSVERYPLAIDRVDDVGAGEDALLLGRVAGALVRADRTDLGLEGLDRGPVAGGNDLVQRGVLGRDGEEGHPEHRIRAGGEHRQLQVRMPLDGEIDLGADGLADPVALLDEHGVRPARQLIGVLEQFLGVRGDAHVPLRQFLLDHRRTGAPALAVDHLFVGEHGVEAGRPVHQRGFAVDQALLDQIEEDVLLARGIAGIRAGELARPGVAEAHALELTAHVGDVLVGPFLGVGAALDRRLLGRQAEGVPAHRMQDVETAHALVTRHRVTDGVVAHVPHVQLARGVGEHLEHVVALLTRQVVAHLVGLGGLPPGLPFRFDGGGVIGAESWLGLHRSGG
jgi:hypothetical protein